MESSLFVMTTGKEFPPLHQYRAFDRDCGMPVCLSVCYSVYLDNAHAGINAKSVAADAGT